MCFETCLVKLCLVRLAVSKHAFQSIQIVCPGKVQICSAPVCSAESLAKL